MEAKKKFSINDFLSISGMGVTIAFVALCIILSILTKNFLTYSNIINVIRQSVVYSVIALGMTFIIATGEIDLSVGAITGFTGMLCAALIIDFGMNPAPAIIITLIVGIVIGLVNGFMVARVGIASFISTLAIQQILRGLMYVYSRGMPIFGLKSPGFKFIGQGYIGPIPFPIILLAILTVIFWYVMNRTKFGRYVLSTGSNRQAATLVGINVRRIISNVYVICAFMCTIAGIIFISRSESAVVEGGAGYEVDAISAVVIAGTSMTGGKANVVGCIIGAVLMTTIRNGLNLMKVESSWHQVVIGAVIMLALIFDRFTNREGK